MAKAASPYAPRHRAMDRFDPGRFYLVSDFRVSCNWADERYMRHYPWACFFAVFYPLGIPGGLWWLLRTRRDQRDEFGHGWTERLRLVTKSYSERFWWFEVYELLRKCMLCGILIFIMPETATQVAVGLLIAGASSSLQLHFRSVVGLSHGRLPRRNGRVARRGVRTVVWRARPYKSWLDRRKIT